MQSSEQQIKFYSPGFTSCSRIGAELLQSVREMKAGRHGRVHHREVSPVAEARYKVGFYVLREVFG
jgi:hypothetical protein